jgi:hypothetical protein
VEQELAEPFANLYLALAVVREGISDNRGVVFVDYIALTVAGCENDCTPYGDAGTDEWRNINILGIDESGVDSTQCDISRSLPCDVVLLGVSGICIFGGEVASHFTLSLWICRWYQLGRSCLFPASSPQGCPSSGIGRFLCWGGFGVRSTRHRRVRRTIASSGNGCDVVGILLFLLSLRIFLGHRWGSPRRL